MIEKFVVSCRFPVGIAVDLLCIFHLRSSVRFSLRLPTPCFGRPTAARLPLSAWETSKGQQLSRLYIVFKTAPVQSSRRLGNYIVATRLGE